MQILGRISPQRGFFAVALVALFGFFAAAFVPGVVSAAGTASFSLSPSSGSFTVGDTISVRISENSSVPVNGVGAHLSYDKNLLELSNIDSSQSAFPAAGPSSAGGGIIKLSKVFIGAREDYPNGTQTVAVINFKAKAAGNAAISFLSSSQITAFVSAEASENVWNGNTAGANLTIKNPGASTPASGGSSNSGGSSGGSTSSGGGSQSSPGGGGGSSAAPGGGGGSTGTSEGGVAAPTTVQNAPANSTELPQVLTPTGASVAIRVLDVSGKPVKGALVTLPSGQKTKTNEEGVAGFLNVAAGEYKVKISYGGEVKDETIAVSPGTTDLQPQEFKVKIDKTAASDKPYWIVYIALAVIVLGTLGIVFPRRPHFALPGQHNSMEANDIVVGDFSRRAAPPANQPTPGDQIRPTDFHATHIQPKQQAPNPGQSPGANEQSDEQKPQ